MLHTVLATTYPGGAGAVFSGIAWALLLLISALAAVVAAALSPFARTVTIARGLSRVGLWGGSLALALAITVTTFIACDQHLGFGSPAYRRRVVGSLVDALLTAIVLLVALGAKYWSRQTRRRRDQDDAV